jgi:aerobic carbon-monoxide dehydrogenase medium subunit
VLRPFALLRPATLPEVADILDAHADEVVLYAGGTELLLLMKEGVIRPRGLVDVKRVAGLGGIAEEGGALAIGATVRHREVEQSPVVAARCPLLAGVARHVANVRVRNVGTVGGNLAFADPHSDLATVFLALDATVQLWSRRGARAVGMGEFVRGAYETARADDEVLTAVRFDPWADGTVAAYLKYGVYERPTLGVALALTPGRGGAIAAARVAVGCVGHRPQRLQEVEGAAAGRALRDVDAGAEDLAAAAAREVETVGDRHGSAEYKREMTRVFVKRALGLAAARARGEEGHLRHPHTVVV